MVSWTNATRPAETWSGFGPWTPYLAKPTLLSLQFTSVWLNLLWISSYSPFKWECGWRLGLRVHFSEQISTTDVRKQNYCMSTTAGSHSHTTPTKTANWMNHEFHFWETALYITQTTSFLCIVRWRGLVSTVVSVVGQLPKGSGLNPGGAKVMGTDRICEYLPL